MNTYATRTPIPPPTARTADETTLPRKVAALLRNISNTRRHWCGTQQEYTDWAEKRIGEALRTFADHVYITYPRSDGDGNYR